MVSSYLMLREPYYLETKRYNICMGREEAFLYKDLDFLSDQHQDLGPLSRISHKEPSRQEEFHGRSAPNRSCFRWILNLLYKIYIIIVPYCYVNIYRFR